MQEITLKVEGMKCQGCEKRIQNAVEAIEGVKKVTAKHKKGTVTVKAQDEISKNEIAEKITNIGFEIVEE